VSECIFAPYFDSEQGAAHFAAVHKVFGASNVSKLLLQIPAHKRLDAVVTICYEAQARLRDPVYGCVAHIFALQQQVYIHPSIIYPSIELNLRVDRSSILHASLDYGREKPSRRHAQHSTASAASNRQLAGCMPCVWIWIFSGEGSIPAARVCRVSSFWRRKVSLLWEEINTAKPSNGSAKRGTPSAKPGDCFPSWTLR
jgi:hypothetical protein